MEAIKRFHSRLNILNLFVAMITLAMVSPLALNLVHLSTDWAPMVFTSMSVCVMSIFLLMGVAQRLGIIDSPGGRKQHKRPTPTVGGLAMFMGVLFGLYWHNLLGSSDVHMLFGCSAALVALGVLDDKQGLPVSLRIFIQVLLVTMVIVSTNSQITHLGALFGSDIQLGLLAIPFTIIAFVGGINAMNMIDGADGMAGKMAAITIFGVATLFYCSGAVELLPITWAMLGALIGFLILNARIFVKQALVFMGDAGSMWLGLVLGWLMVKVTQDQVAAEPALVLWLFGIPLLDTLTVIFRRISRNKSPFAADRTHIHHVLENMGFSIQHAVHILSVAQLIMVSAGVGFYLMHASAAMVFWSFVMLFSAYYFLLKDVLPVDES